MKGQTILNVGRLEPVRDKKPVASPTDKQSDQIIEIIVDRKRKAVVVRDKQ